MSDFEGLCDITPSVQRSADAEVPVYAASTSSSFDSEAGLDGMLDFDLGVTSNALKFDQTSVDSPSFMRRREASPGTDAAVPEAPDTPALADNISPSASTEEGKEKGDDNSLLLPRPEVMPTRAEHMRAGAWLPYPPPHAHPYYYPYPPSGYPHHLPPPHMMMPYPPGMYVAPYRHAPPAIPPVMHVPRSAPASGAPLVASGTSPPTPKSVLPAAPVSPPSSSPTSSSGEVSEDAATAAEDELTRVQRVERYLKKKRSRQLDQSFRHVERNMHAERHLRVHAHFMTKAGMGELHDPQGAYYSLLDYPELDDEMLAVFM